MKKRGSPVVFLSILFVLMGCSAGMKEEVQLIAAEKSLPRNFSEIAHERKEPPYYSYLVKRAASEKEFQEAAELFELKNRMPQVDFSNNEILFIGLLESGSCPSQLKNVEISPKQKELNVHVARPDGNCTADATPRTFVIEMVKAAMEKLENVVIIEAGNRTEVPIKP